MTTTTTPQDTISGLLDVVYTKADGIATITINRPEVLNAFRRQTIEEMISAITDAERDGSIGVIVLTGAGDRAFCVGGDQTEMVSVLDRAGWYELAGRLQVLFGSLAGVTKPTVAAVNGWCIGGGHELHCFCDLTIAADHARFGQVGARVGGGPIFITRMLPRLVGEKRAREILLLCEQYTAEQAREFGLVNRVVPAAELPAAVRALCDRLLGMSPSVVKALKLGLGGAELLTDPMIPALIENLAHYFGSAEHLEATGAFAARREPDFAPFRGGTREVHGG